MAGFFNVIPIATGTGKVGLLEEFASSAQIFENPRQQATRDYVTGRFG
jgi:phosphate transport system ATP-binding protein